MFAQQLVTPELCKQLPRRFAFKSSASLVYDAGCDNDVRVLLPNVSVKHPALGQRREVLPTFDFDPPRKSSWAV